MYQFDPNIYFQQKPFDPFSAIIQGLAMGQQIREAQQKMGLAKLESSQAERRLDIAQKGLAMDQQRVDLENKKFEEDRRIYGLKEKKEQDQQAKMADLMAKRYTMTPEQFAEEYSLVTGSFPDFYERKRQETIKKAEFEASKEWEKSKFNSELGFRKEQFLFEKKKHADEMGVLAEKIRQASAEQGVKSAEVEQKTAKELRNEFINASKGFVDREDSYNQIQATSPNAAGDLNLIYAYMKMLDPGSVVRESEGQLLVESSSIPERVKAAAQKAFSGEKFTDAVRNQFKAEAKNIYVTAKKAQDERKSRYETLAQKQGIKDVSWVTGTGVGSSKVETKSSTGSSTSKDGFSIRTGDMRKGAQK